MAHVTNVETEWLPATGEFSSVLGALHRLIRRNPSPRSFSETNFPRPMMM